MTAYYNDDEKKIIEKCSKLGEEIVKKQWNKISLENQIDDEYERNFINIMDDILKNAVKVYPAYFFTDIKKYVLTRGRRNKWSNPEDIMPPTVEIAKTNGSMNRWNPPNKRYNYLVISKSEMDIETSLLETRTTAGKYTVAIFYPVKAISKLLDLNYEEHSIYEIYKDLKNSKHKIIDKLEEKYAGANLSSRKKRRIIKKVGEKKKKYINEVVTIFAAKTLLKYICDVIFVPLSDEEDADNTLKEKCYKSFHIFAEYLEEQGIEGVRYPSTRQKINDKQGDCLVLFDADSVKPIVETMKVIEAEDYLSFSKGNNGK